MKNILGRIDKLLDCYRIMKKPGIWYITRDMIEAKEIQAYLLWERVS